MFSNCIEQIFFEKTNNIEYSILFSQWNFDKTLIANALKAMPIIFPHYSLHDESHSQTILKNISKLLGADNISSLKSYEIIDQIGGIKTLCEKLEVNPNIGLTSDDYYNSDNPKIQSKSYTLRKKNFGSFNPSLNSQEYKSFIRCFFDFFSRKVFLFILILAQILNN